MVLLAIQESLSENDLFAGNPLCTDALTMTIDFYKRAGFVKPWIGYFAEKNGDIVGSAGFKGAPKNGSVEIAYGTMEAHRNKGIGAEMCRELVNLALQTNPSIRITARTLPEENFSARILRKNQFRNIGIVADPEDGDVWEWVYSPAAIA